MQCLRSALKAIHVESYVQIFRADAHVEERTMSSMGKSLQCMQEKKSLCCEMHEEETKEESSPRQK